MAENNSATRPALKFLAGFLPEDRRYWLLVPLVGLLAGFSSVGLSKVLDMVEYFAWGTTDHIFNAAERAVVESPARVVATLAAAGLVACLFGLLRRRGNELQGTSAVIETLAFRRGRLPFLRTVTDALVSLTCVGVGASLGREGAFLQCGAAVGSTLGSKFRLDDYHVRVLLACGAAGGMAASYNVPVGASVFAMEVLLGSFALELIGPIIVSSFLSTLVSRSLLGETPLYQIPHYKLVTQWEVLLNLLLGILLGLVSVLFIRVFSGIGKLFAWLRPVERVKPLLALVLVGLIGLKLPHLFGNGYDTVNQVLGGVDPLSVGMLLSLPIFKILTTTLCRGGGIPGGLFTPSLFVGALLGAAFGMGAKALWPPGSVAEPGAYALVGMGAILAGTLQAPITAILMIFEMTQDYEIIMPLMSACAASAIVSHVFQRASLLTEPLRRRGIHLPGAFTPTWIRQPKVESVIENHAVTVSPAARFQQVVDDFLMAPEGHDQVYVTNKEGTYIGSVSLHDIKRYFRESEHLDSVIAADVVNTQAPFVYADDPLSRAIEILAQSDTEHLPVLDSAESRKLLGTISKRALLAAYRMANIAHQVETPGGPTAQG